MVVKIATFLEADLHFHIRILNVRHVIPDNCLRVRTVRSCSSSWLLVASLDHDRYNIRTTRRLLRCLILNLVLGLILDLILNLDLILRLLSPSLLVVRTRLLELMMARLWFHVEHGRSVLDLNTIIVS